jgi:hypothetical protein
MAKMVFSYLPATPRIDPSCDQANLMFERFVIITIGAPIK